MRDSWLARRVDAARALPNDLLALGAAALLAHLLWLLPLPLGWRGAGAALLLALPGMLLALLLFADERDPLLLSFLALCGGLALQVALLLGLHALPGPLSWPLVLVACDGLSMWLGWLWLRQRSRAGSAPQTKGAREHTLISPAAGIPYASAILAGILLLAAGLRLAFLGGAELQGDEARALLLALDAVNGREDILLWHSKGPVEALLPAGMLALLGNINEWAARLPFALAGVGVPLGAYLLARQVCAGQGRSARYGQVAGLVAAGALALDGFLIAFSRIVQYQNVLIVLALGALWCGWRFYEGAAPQRYLVAAAGFAAAGLLAHYDTLFAVPALAWLVLAGGRRRGWRARQWARGLALPLAVGGILVASFYIPFVLHEHFQRTLAYLQSRTGQTTGGLALFNNLLDYYRRATFYNTTFQIDGLGVALALGVLAWCARYVRPRALAWALVVLLLLGCALLLLAPERFALPSGGSWAILAFGLPLAALVLVPATPARLRMSLLWLAPPFLAEAFLFVKPMTHFYTIDAAAALLVGLAVAGLAEWLNAHGLGRLRLPLAIGGVALAALALPYLYLVFVRQSPEYRAVFPAARPAIYRASYGDQLPSRDGYFGFPHRAGWKVIGELYRAGMLKGDFDSNEDFLITHWYTGKMPRCEISPDYYFLAQSPIDPDKVPLDQVEASYHLFGTVMVDGVAQLKIYSRQPAQARIFVLGDYIGDYERQPLISSAAQSRRIELLPGPQASAQWQQGLALLSDNLEAQSLVPGQDATLSFQWHADAALAQDYGAFLELVDARGQVASTIGPLCSAKPAAQWHTRSAVETSIIWDVAGDLAPGDYALQLGLRDRQSGAALPLADGAHTLRVATLRVVTR